MSCLRVLLQTLLITLALGMGCTPPECFNDTQCGAGETCLAESCVDRCNSGKECRSNGEECGGTWDPVTSTWLEARVCRSAACECLDPNAVCIEIEGGGRQCALMEACTAVSCQSGYACGAIGGESACICSDGDCGPKCSTDEECGADLSCSDGRCETVRCKVDRDCPEDQRCGVQIQSGVAERGCVDGGSTEEGERCVDSAECETAFCGDDGDGRATCRSLCETDKDCPKRRQCTPTLQVEGFAGGLCLPPLDGCRQGEQPVLLSTGVACSRGERCEGDSECLGVASCQAGQCTCLEGDCDLSCEGDTDCPLGTYCDGESCRLQESCEGDEDCAEEEACRPSPGALNAGRHCISIGDTELHGPCSVASDCESTYCVGTCEEPCSSGSECGSGECRVTANDQLSFATCQESVDKCTGTAVRSTDGSCVTGSLCAADTDCPLDSEGIPLTCHAGVCHTACSSRQDCSELEECLLAEDGSASFCGENSDCGCTEDEYCERGVCLPSHSCTDDTHCPGGFCIGGQCRSRCETNVQCRTVGPGLECVALHQTQNGLARICASPRCGCDSPRAWCLPTAPNNGLCQRGEDCSDCATGFTCQALGGRVAGVAESCGCTSDLICGRLCSRDPDCPGGNSCGPFGRCAPPNSCRTGSDCEADEDCLRTNFDPSALGVCGPEECRCRADDACDVSSPARNCTQLGQCSVLGTDCAQGYTCDGPSKLCVCTSPEKCQGQCMSHKDCPQGKVCQGLYCRRLPCTKDSDCAEGTVCGGGADPMHCVQPGEGEDAQLCSSWTDCRSGYCFGGNSCANPCTSTQDCSAAETCQAFSPDAFPREPPICHAQVPSCKPPCRTDQWCDNDPESPRCVSPTPAVPTQTMQ